VDYQNVVSSMNSGLPSGFLYTVGLRLDALLRWDDYAASLDSVVGDVYRHFGGTTPSAESEALERAVLESTFRGTFLDFSYAEDVYGGWLALAHFEFPNGIFVFALETKWPLAGPFQTTPDTINIGRPLLSLNAERVAHATRTAD
jgi:hypothetical protein